jgi:2-phospho-L-lactate transferase/gluconeogenesis factor (CofD/UPF0052 family)
MLESLGGRASASGVAEHYTVAYPGLIDVFVVDVVDADEAAALRTQGARVDLLDTVMRDHVDRRRLAEAILAAHLQA